MRFRDEDYLKAFPREKPKKVKVEIIEKKEREEEIMTNAEPVEDELEKVEVVEKEDVEDGNERDDKSSE